jgi:hypothetical protein
LCEGVDILSVALFANAEGGDHHHDHWSVHTIATRPNRH